MHGQGVPSASPLQVGTPAELRGLLPGASAIGLTGSREGRRICRAQASRRDGLSPRWPVPVPVMEGEVGPWPQAVGETRRAPSSERANISARGAGASAMIAPATSPPHRMPDRPKTGPLAALHCPGRPANRSGRPEVAEGTRQAFQNAASRVLEGCNAWGIVSRAIGFRWWLEAESHPLPFGKPASEPHVAAQRRGFSSLPHAGRRRTPLTLPAPAGPQNLLPTPS